MADHPPIDRAMDETDVSDLLANFLGRFGPDERARAKDVLELGRKSYRLRDDDNIHMKKIEHEFARALEHGRQRLARRKAVPGALQTSEVAAMLRDPEQTFTGDEERRDDGPRHLPGYKTKPRQLKGQPAGTGIATGVAHVIKADEDLFALKRGEVMVCDAVDPNMTFVVPLCAAIVERRGGMLIHGAIIAREYGLPCVTGVPDASSLIETGARVTVDGFLGIVTVLG
jgi:pyruvate,water dikinase